VTNQNDAGAIIGRNSSAGVRFRYPYINSFIGSYRRIYDDDLYPF
jgi:hypothetical protein